MNKKLMLAFVGGAASGIIAYLFYKKIARQMKNISIRKNKVLPSYPLKGKDPHAWGEYTL
jgi:hypothetical protein